MPRWQYESTDYQDRAQRQLREAIGAQMEQDTAYCSVDEFIKHYLPFSIPQTHLEGYITSVKKQATLFSPTRRPSQTAKSELGCYSRRLKSIFKAICDLQVQGRQPNGLCFEAMVSDDSSQPRIVGSTHRVDAVVRDGEEDSPLRVLDVVVPMGLKRVRKPENTRENRLQLASLAVQIMNEDVRRGFIYGLTLEDHRVSLWYFSRTHSVKSHSFDIRKKPDVLISTFISFMFATREELGFSPFITRNADETYIYKLETDTGTCVFKATHSLKKHRKLYIAGHSPRIFQVIEVASEEDHTPKEGTQMKILKDVWVDETSVSEGIVQQRLFNDIQKFAAGDWRSSPHLKAFLPENTKGKGEAFLDDIGRILEGQNYQDLFLVITGMAKGEVSKRIAPTARPSDLVFVPKSETEKPSETYWGSYTRIVDPKPRPRFSWDSEPRPPRYTPKQRHFFVFDDFCTPVDELPSVGDALDVLRECLTALLLMYCAGWVHHDISTGNILSVQKEGRWHVKLADLEFSKVFTFPSESGKHEPRIGTRPFMAIEILQRQYLSRPPLTAEEKEYMPYSMRDFKTKRPARRTNPVIHNFQHDLESLFWIILWLITSHVGHSASETWAAPAFADVGDSIVPVQRLVKFQDSTVAEDLDTSLHPSLQQLACPVDGLRELLHSHGSRRAYEQGWSTIGSYSETHWVFFSFFRYINDRELVPPGWRDVKLQGRDNNEPYPIPLANTLLVQDPPKVIHKATDGKTREGEGGIAWGTKKRSRDEEEDSGRETVPKRSKARHTSDTPSGSKSIVDSGNESQKSALPDRVNELSS